MSDVTCKGSFALGTACGRCSKCKAEIEEYEVRKTARESLDGTSVLKMQVTGWQNVAQVNGAVADQAKVEVARLTAELQKQSTLMGIGFAEDERRLATARRDVKISDINAEAMAEIKAVLDGKSSQTIEQIVSGALEEIRTLAQEEPNT